MESNFSIFRSLEIVSEQSWEHLQAIDPIEDSAWVCVSYNEVNEWGQHKISRICTCNTNGNGHTQLDEVDAVRMPSPPPSQSLCSYSIGSWNKKHKVDFLWSISRQQKTKHNSTHTHTKMENRSSWYEKRNTKIYWKLNEFGQFSRSSFHFKCMTIFCKSFDQSDTTNNRTKRTLRSGKKRRLPSENHSAWKFFWQNPVTQTAHNQLLLLCLFWLLFFSHPREASVCEGDSMLFAAQFVSHCLILEKS